MSKKHVKQKFSSSFYKCMSVLMSVSILSGSLLILSFIKAKTSAYLYDEDTTEINYNVAQLSFDLSSNHMYSYYNEDNTYNVVFEGLLDDINTLKMELENGTIDNETFDNLVKGKSGTSEKKYLAEYYSTEFIDDLQTAWDKSVNISDNSFSQSTYNDECYKIYNAYYHEYEYMFIIKNVEMSTVIESGRSIWYYYVADLISKYYGEYTDQDSVRYISQNNATVVSQSTTKVGVKLKGGTTYSNDQRGQYYDPLFNDMVSPLTLNLRNSGSVSLFLNFSLDLNPELNDSNENKGILAMVLPYGYDFISLKQDTTYSTFFSNGKWDYRGLIQKLLSDQNGNIDCSKLSFSQMQEMLTSYNKYALSTYQTNNNTNDYHNYEVVKYPSTPVDPQVEYINTSMLVWADYEQNAIYYDSVVNSNETTDMESWRVGDTYKLINYNFTAKIMSSFNGNYDYSSFTDEDWQLMFNKKQDYSKIAGVSNFNVKGYAYFEQDDKTSIYANTYYYESKKENISEAQNYMTGGYFKCLYKDSDIDEPNHISKLRFNVRFAGYSPAYLRVRLIEQFTNSKGEIVAINQLKFNTNKDWHDNRVNDLYYYSDQLYYSSDNRTVTASGTPKYLNIPVITGMQSPTTELKEQFAKNSNLTLKITFFVEAVQPNRTEEYWKKTVDDIKGICSEQ